jgi:transcriptional regulator with XRE-family HTH domain
MLKERGLSQSFVSEKVGMSRNYIKDCKRLNSDIPADRLKMIADILGTTVEYLTDQTDSPAKQEKPAAISDELWNKIENDPKAVKLLEMILNMSPEQRDRLERFLEEM